MTPRSGEQYLNARTAATYVGYTPDGSPARRDKQMRAFYALMRRHRVEKHWIGRRLLFLKRDLDRAVQQSTAEGRSSLDAMEELARRHARGEPASVS